MIGQQDFILISSIEWDFLWQGQQEIAARLARAGNRVLYIENTGVRAPRLADARRIYRRVKNWSGTLLSHGLRRVADNLYVCSPLVLPPFGAVWQEILNRRLFLPLISKAVESLRMREPVIWTFLPTNTAVDLMRRLQSPGVVNVYYCIADFGHLTSNEDRLIQSERELLEMCDLVFAQGPELAAHCSLESKRVHVFSFGVNLDLFPGGHINNSAVANCVGETRNGRDDLFKKMKRPIVGYVGGLHRHIDWALLEAIANDRPDWSWVFVGPQQTQYESFTNGRMYTSWASVLTLSCRL